MIPNNYNKGISHNENQTFAGIFGTLSFLSAHLQQSYQNAFSYSLGEINNPKFLTYRPLLKNIMKAAYIYIIFWVDFGLI